MTAPKIPTEHWSKPIPTSLFDWSAAIDDYELGHPNRFMSAATSGLEERTADLEARIDGGARG
jgi:hypothetical protein